MRSLSGACEALCLVSLIVLAAIAINGCTPSSEPDAPPTLAPKSSPIREEVAPPEQVAETVPEQPRFVEGPSPFDPSYGPKRKTGNWWPERQLQDDFRFEAREISDWQAWEHEVDYGRVMTPGAPSTARLETFEESRRLSLSFLYLPGWNADGWPVYPLLPSPEEMSAQIVNEDGELIRELEEEPYGTWSGSARIGMRGKLTFTFTRLEMDYRDHWIQVVMRGERFWFLIPPGLLSAVKGEDPPSPQVHGRPRLLDEIQAKDEVLIWRSVTYEFTRFIEPHLTLRVKLSNLLPVQVELTLIDFKGFASFTPELTVACAIPDAAPARGVSMASFAGAYEERHEVFAMESLHWDKRGWGVLSVAFGEESREVRIPSVFMVSGAGFVQH